MDLRKIGIAFIFIGIVLTVVFIDNKTYYATFLTVVVWGFFLTIVGYIFEIKKRKEINDKLDKDIETVLQPIITKYSNLNKQYRQQYSGDEYVSKRLQLNQDLEKELSDNLPYFESREIKKIVIEFNREQDKM